MDRLRVFADDIAFVIASLCKIARVYRAFRAIALGTNLKVKANKCAVIPLFCLPADCNEQAPGYIAAACVSKALRAHAPDWRGFAVSLCVKHLGVWMGPRSRDVFWREAMAKFADRAQRLGGTPLVASVTAVEYSVRILPVLS